MYTKIRSAAAHRSGVTFSPAKPKSQMSRGNMGLSFFLTVASLLMVSSVYAQDALTEEMVALLQKSNKVYLEIEDKETSLSGQYLVKAFNEWGYWTVVDDVRDAQFIIAIHIKMSEKKASKMNAEIFAEFKTVENQVFKKTRTYAGSPAAINGFHAYKGAAMRLMNMYFKRTFK